MAEPLFVAQPKLESWIDAGEVTFSGTTLTILAEGRSYTLAPAVQVRTLIDGADSQHLLGRILLVADLPSLGAEHSSGTLIVGDVGYECDEGYIGTLQEAHGSFAADQPAVDTTSSDTELLTQFLLKHL